MLQSSPAREVAVLAGGRSWLVWLKSPVHQARFLAGRNVQRQPAIRCVPSHRWFRFGGPVTVAFAARPYTDRCE